MKEIRIGTSGTAKTIVTYDNSAISVGSGSLMVFSTPMMIALMEKAACNAISEYLENDETTVGTMLNITHDRATPEGIAITATATVTEINGREIVFNVIAEDENGNIGMGMHKRFVVYAKKFMSKINV